MDGNLSEGYPETGATRPKLGPPEAENPGPSFSRKASILTPPWFFHLSPFFWGRQHPTRGLKTQNRNEGCRLGEYTKRKGDVGGPPEAPPLPWEQGLRGAVARACSPCTGHPTPGGLSQKPRGPLQAPPRGRGGLPSCSCSEPHLQTVPTRGKARLLT